MELLWDSPWRAAPTVALAAIGVLLVVRAGFRFRLSLRLAHNAPGKNLALMQSMRFVLGGLALLLIGAGWQLQLPVLIAIGAVIGFEEMIETSIAAHALSEEKQRDEAARQQVRPG